MDDARRAAKLNHPNIAAIYGVERSGSTPALVMELVEGVTLADRIAQGPLPLAEALFFADGLICARELRKRALAEEPALTAFITTPTSTIPAATRAMPASIRAWVSAP